MSQRVQVGGESIVVGGEKVEVPVGDEDDVLCITPLGAGNEVGRSCIVLSFKGKNIMNVTTPLQLDCGIHPAHSGLAGLPFFDEIDPAEIDLLLISHFHLDHAAALPYFLEKTAFQGRVLMTHATKAIYKILLSDFVKVSNISVDDVLYDEAQLNKSLDRIEQIDFHQEFDHGGVRIWAYNAGHVLGAAMFMLEIAGVRILYTGDFSRDEDRHLMPAETPAINPDVLIIESTYGVQIHEPRKDREKFFTERVHEIVSRGGRCLLPVFALGRAQELLLILDEYWEKHRLNNIPIYYASNLAKKCMSIYQTFVNMMNERIREQSKIRNPFEFKHISFLRSLDHFQDTRPCVVMASPGMLQSGTSRDLFERWCSNPKNGVILAGYCVEGTLAKHIVSDPSEINTVDGLTLPLRMSVHTISFSAHSDFQQTSEFIDQLMPPNVVLVHGDSNEMSRLKHSLDIRYEGKNVQVLTPRNCQTVKLEFRGEKIARAVGTIAAEQDGQGEKVVSGLLVQKDFKYQMVAPHDLHLYTHLTTAEVHQRQQVPFSQKFSLLEACLRRTYNDIKETLRHDNVALLVCGQVYVVAEARSHLLLEWTSNSVNDMLADSVLAIILQIEANPATSHIVQDAGQEWRDGAQLASSFLKEHYDDVRVDEDDIRISNGTSEATIHYGTKKVECDDAAMREQVQRVLKRICAVVDPL